MTRRAWIWAALFALLAAVLTGTLPGGRAGEGAIPAWRQAVEPLLAIETGDIVEMRFESTSRTDRIERTAEGWVLQRDGVRWPVEDSAVRGFLRLLATTSGDPAADDARAPDATLSMATTSGPSGAVEFLGGPIGGTSVVRVGARTLRVDDDLWRIVVESGPASWATPALLPGIGRGLSTLTLTSNAGTLGLRKGGGRWSMTEPRVLRADSAACDQIVVALSGLVATRDAAAPTGEPIARVNATRTMRDGAGAERVREWRLELHPGGSVEGALLAHATILQDGSPIFGPRAAVVDGAALAALTLDPSAYAARQPVLGSSADILSYTVDTGNGSIHTRRPPGGWSEPLARAFEVLSSPTASAVSLRPPFPDDRSSASVTLMGLADATLASLALEFDDSGGAWVVSDGVWWRYEDGSVLRPLAEPSR